MGFALLLGLLPAAAIAVGAEAISLPELVRVRVDQEYPRLFELYKHLHTHPELSFHEAKTAERVAGELAQAGCEVTRGVGGHGVVALLRNGSGPTVLVRTDLDALPVKEQTGLPYASAVTTQDDRGNEVSVMHACGHDVHITSLVGTARLLGQLKDRWRGNLVFIAQPAEERVGGARRMLADGLFTRFPRPDYCLALHVNATLPAGSVGYNEGYVMANVDSVDLTVRGLGGHGASPETTKDPIVLAAQIVLALQTIVSREVAPGEPAVVTVGSIHGGTKYNIIPDEVRLQLTLRSYSDETRQRLLEAIKRICRGLARSAGVPEDRLPIVELADESTPATYNDPLLTRRLAAVFKAWLGDRQVIVTKPVMGAEDFGLFGRTEPKVPICMFTIGAVKPEAVEQSKRTGQALPSLHSSAFAPIPEPTLKTGVTAMTAAVLTLVGTDAK